MWWLLLKFNVYVMKTKEEKEALLGAAVVSEDFMNVVDFIWFNNNEVE